MSTESDFPATVKRVYEAARASGDLVYYETTVEKREEAGVEFEIRYAPTLARKPQNDPTAPHPAATEKPDPFSPYNPALFVTELERHNVLLNKFCVVPEHLLVVTKEFEKQTSPLLPSDLAAVWYCMSNMPSPTMAFYNCGALSGASQPHKHIQIVPLPTTPGAHPPVEALFNKLDEKKPGQIYTFTNLPYIHVMTFMDPGLLYSSTPAEAGAHLSDTFRGLLDTMIELLRAADAPITFSYNCFWTRKFMCMVPRLQESVVMTMEEEEEAEAEAQAREEGEQETRDAKEERESKEITFAINSLGFSGMILCKTKAEVELVMRKGVLRILKAIAVEKSTEEARPEDGDA